MSLTAFNQFRQDRLAKRVERMDVAEEARLVCRHCLDDGFVSAVRCERGFTELTNQVFPWATVVLGFLIGHSIRLAGRGIDWRFPLTAAVMTLAGSLAANIILAASVTAEGYGIGTLQALQAVTSMTWPVFFDEVLTVADVFFAVVGAALAGFYSNRRLTRNEYRALRLRREEQKNG